MSPLEIALALLTGGVSAVGAWAWVRTHTHEELVHRRELELLQAMMRAQHEALLRELGNLRDSLDSGRSRR